MLLDVDKKHNKWGLYIRVMVHITSIFGVVPHHKGKYITYLTYIFCCYCYLYFICLCTTIVANSSSVFISLDTIPFIHIKRQTVIVDTGSGVTAFPCSGCKDCGVPKVRTLALLHQIELFSLCLHCRPSHSLQFFFSFPTVSQKYHIDALFVEASSSSFTPTSCDATQDCISSRSRCTNHQCSITMSYAEGSRWTAYEGVDKCYVAGPHEIPLVSTQAGTTTTT